MGFEKQIVDVFQKALGVQLSQFDVGRVPSTVISEDGTSRILDAAGAAPAGVYPNRLLDELIDVMRRETFKSAQLIDVVKAHCRLR